ncbi:MAG TPA: CYTH domain-containing protein, partial [Chloroflexi bacterium]|nr:CYTH domain-containing protein [Chloroflexota bacterium]
MTQFDTLFIHGIVVTMDENFTVIPDGAVAVQGDQIAAVGTTEEVLAQGEAKDVVDCTGMAVIPGLINAHTHVPMTLLRALADDLRLDVWLHGYMMPVEREFVNPDFVRLGTLLGCAEMIRSGTTCFADMYYYEDDVAAAVAEAGLRAVCAETILRFPSPDALSYEESLAYSREFIERWLGHPLIVPSVGPHAPYTATPEMLRAAAELALEYDVPLQIHLNETALEVQESRDEHGMPPIPWVKKQNVFQAKTLAAHCVHVDDGELHTLLHHNVGVAHNPTSNLKLASGVAPVPRMLELGLHVGIGTDGPASNNDLDMFEEVRLAALLAKGISGDPQALPARQALAMATIEGARALHLSHLIGSLEVGKRADIAVVDLSGVHLTPKFARDPDAIYSQLVYAAKAADVRHVWVNGRPLMRDWQVLTLDEPVLQAEAQAIARRIDAFLVAREGNVLDKLVAISDVEIDETFEVQVKVRLDDPAIIEAALQREDIDVVKPTIRRQYDTYFFFDDPEQGRLRYREDEVLDEEGNIKEVFYRLTLTGPAKEREYANAVLLSRSRYNAPATRSLRFYREYFQPAGEREVHKERKRWRIIYRDTGFAVNLDRILHPPTEGYYLEIKSRTWSKADAELKARFIGELLAILGVEARKLERQEYFDLVEAL